jgi:hypothetical protein
MPLTPEELARVEAGCEEEVEQIGDDVDEVAEALAVHSIVSEERHDEILVRVESCQLQLEALSSRMEALSPSMENPILARLLETVSELKGQIESLRSSVDSKLITPPPIQRESIPPINPSSEEGENPEARTESPEAEPPAPKKKRVRVL